MFCVKCGKEASVENFCDGCFLLGNTLFDVDNKEIYFCKNCNNHFLKGKKCEIDEAIKSSIKTKNVIKKIHIKKTRVGNKIHAIITCSGYIKPCKKIKTETGDMLIIIRKRMCDDCIKISGGYYEAIIQIRGEQGERIFKKINNMVKKNLIISINKTEHGYDIRFVNKNDATIIANTLRKQHDVKDSYKFVGEKGGQELYRNVYVIR